MANSVKIKNGEYQAGKVLLECPHCKQKKEIEEFGFRQMENGTIRNQSWCKECRSKDS